MTPKSNIKLIFDSPISCFFVVIGGKHLYLIGDVMKKVNYLTNAVGRKRPLAVFLLTDNNKENIVIDLNYELERYKSTPVMVKSFHKKNKSKMAYS